MDSISAVPVPADPRGGLRAGSGSFDGLRSGSGSFDGQLPLPPPPSISAPRNAPPARAHQLTSTDHNQHTSCVTPVLRLRRPLWSERIHVCGLQRAIHTFGNQPYCSEFGNQSCAAVGVTRISTARSASLTPRSGGSGGGYFGAAEPDFGPRNLRLGDIACLVECSHLAGPDPVAVGAYES